MDLTHYGITRKRAAELTIGDVIVKPTNSGTVYQVVDHDSWSLTSAHLALYLNRVDVHGNIVSDSEMAAFTKSQLVTALIDPPSIDLQVADDDNG